MSANFTEATLAGHNAEYARLVADLRDRYGFDFVAMGLTAFVGAPLKWVYSAGATSERHKRIALAPGHGIGGIVIKSGKPMLFPDIDRDMDPQEYSSYPIVFAEDLRSFYALPLVRESKVVGALLCAFRTTDPSHGATLDRLVSDLRGRFGDLSVIASDFLDFDDLAENDAASLASRFSHERGDGGDGTPLGRTELSRVIKAQEDERRRISRDLHDGVAQEVLAVSFALRRLADIAETNGDTASLAVIQDATGTIERIIDDLHNISVELRPLSLDHLGFVAALHSQAAVLEKTYGVRVEFSGSLSCERFARSHETQAYRICQEALLNACKYSDGDTVFVHLEDADGWLRVEVRDTGRGFDTEHPTVRGTGCGLPGMQERARLIGASLGIESGPGGTTVTLVAPMDVGREEAVEVRQ